jgi:polysaccharide transporter, PST family
MHHRQDTGQLARPGRNAPARPLATARRWLLNSAATLGGELGSKGLQLVSFVILARSLQPEGLAAYSLALILLGVAMVFTNLGLDVVGLRQVAERPQSARAIALRLSLIQLGMSLTVMPLLLAAAGLIGLRVGGLFVTVAVIALYLPFFAFNVSWALAATERLQAVAAARLVARTGFVVWCLLIVGGSTVGAAAGWAVAGFVESAIVWAILLRDEGGHERWVGATLTVPSLIRRGAPFIGAQLTGSIYIGFDQVLLGLIAGGSVLGHYAAIFNVVWPITGLVTVLHGPSLAGLVRQYQRNPHAFWDMAIPIGKLTSIVAVSFFAAFPALGPSLLPELLGNEYGDSSLLIILLGGAAAVALCRGYLALLLIVPHRDRQYLLNSLGLLCVDVVGVAILAPIVGAVGAAAALVVAEVAAVSMALWAWRKELPSAARTLAPWFAAIPFCALAMLGPGGGVVVLVAGTAWLFRAVPEVLQARRRLIAYEGAYESA